MTTDQRKSAPRRDFIVAAVIVTAGFVVSGVSLAKLASSQAQVAQLAQTQTSPPEPATNNNSPAESKPGGARPTTPAPEPARPDAEAQKAGATPALLPAPAEKTGEPIKPGPKG